MKSKKRDLHWFKYKPLRTEYLQSKLIDKSFKGDRDQVKLPDGKGIAWLMNDVFHRVDGPALITYDGIEVWMQKGKLHRPGLPCVDFSKSRCSIFTTSSRTSFSSSRTPKYKPYTGMNCYIYKQEDTTGYVNGNRLTKKELKLYMLKQIGL
jgi:hypothetical protein